MSTLAVQKHMTIKIEQSNKSRAMILPLPGSDPSSPTAKAEPALVYISSTSVWFSVRSRQLVSASSGLMSSSAADGSSEAAVGEVPASSPSSQLRWPMTAAPVLIHARFYYAGDRYDDVMLSRVPVALRSQFPQGNYTLGVLANLASEIGGLQVGI